MSKLIKKQGFTLIELLAVILILGVIALIAIPNSVISIGDSAFLENSFTTASIGSNIQTIGSDAFLDNKITSININRSKDSVSGSPWGATGANIIWSGSN